MMLRYSNITEVATRCYVRKRPSPLPPACCFCMLLPFAFAYWPHVEYITICIYISRLQNTHPHNTTHSNTPHQTRPVWVSPGCVWLVVNFRVSIYTYTIGAIYIYIHAHRYKHASHTNTRICASTPTAPVGAMHLPVLLVIMITAQCDAVNKSR